MRLADHRWRGHIGSVVAARLIADGHQVTVLDGLSMGHAGAVPAAADAWAFATAGAGA
jgi:UDP-glucose 4-epimerase